MAFTNFDTKEINCKIIFFGCEGSGKTENLRSIYKSTSSDMQSGLLEFADQSMDKKFFDFLPVSLGYVNEFHVKLHLYTLPQNPLYETVVSTILKGIDGYVFVADSNFDAMGENVEALLNAKKILSEDGLNPNDLPAVFQYNKRDLQGAVSVEKLRQELNPLHCDDCEAVASQDKGTMETIQKMSKLVLRRLANVEGA
jgi:mutual gliding-motility protein MglA